MCIKNLFKKPQEIIIPEPVAGTIEISRQDYLDVVWNKYHVLPYSHTDPLDSEYWLTPKTELDRIAPELVYPADWYVEGIWDCEDYGLQAQLDAGRKFRCCVRLGLGYIGEGYHGFAMALDTDKKLWILEPNAGFPWAGEWFEPDSGEEKYEPKKVFA